MAKVRHKNTDKVSRRKGMAFLFDSFSLFSIVMLKLHRLVGVPVVNQTVKRRAMDIHVSANLFRYLIN